MNDDFSQQNQPARDPENDQTGPIVPRHQPVWRPTDEIEDAQVAVDEDLANDPLLTTPQRIDVSGEEPAGEAYNPDYEHMDSDDYESRADEYRYYGESSDTAYDDETSDDEDSATLERSEIPPHEKELELMDHLRELRQRMLRSFAAIAIAMMLTWNYRTPLLDWFSAPMAKAVKEKGGILITLGPAEGFMLYIQITFAAAVLLVIPVILYQLWAFIEPALTRKERRYGIVLVPFSVSLFFGGALLGYYLTPLFFRFFLEFQPPGTQPTWSYASSAALLAKMLLVFGTCFQVPVVAIFANKIGLVSRESMIAYWRHVVVVIFIFVAVITPTWDPITMCAAALPPSLLYAFSIWLVKWLK